MPTVHYSAYVYRAADESFDVVFPDFPGCVSGGPSASEALRNAEESLAFHIEGLDGPLPRPRDIDAPPPDWAEPWDVLALVPVDLPGRAVRVQITLDEGLLARIDRAAAARGMSRSALLAEGARGVMTPAVGVEV